MRLRHTCTYDNTLLAGWLAGWLTSWLTNLFADVGAGYLVFIIVYVFYLIFLHKYAQMAIEDGPLLLYWY